MVLATLVAQGSSPGAGGNLISLVMIAAVFLIFYVLLILPARKRQKAHDQMVKALAPGDSVVTSGGIVGKVVKAEESSLRVRIAPSVEVTVLRSHIAGKAQEETP